MNRMKRVTAYKQAVERVELVMKLNNLSMTKWTFRLLSLTALWTRLNTIVEVVEELKEQNDKRKSQRSALLHSLL